jgi:UDP-hydrolysing UDP-N-acetyl-D-glucosamine 2-epimerase
MGEDEWRVFMVGAPCIDIIKDRKLPSREDIEKKFSIDLTKPLLLVLQHSVSTEPEEAEAQITKTLEAVTLFKHQTIIIYPNSDAGGRAIIKKIREYESLPFVQAHANLSQDEYYALLKYASILIGNSSSGVIETPSFRLPVINIGIRQEDRARANNVIDCMHNKEEIAYAIKRALSPEFMTTMKNCISPYGEGGTAEKIVEVLRSININKKLLQKKNTY